MLCSDGIRADKHTLDEVVRIALDDRSVHKRAGVALVGVADKIFFVSGAQASRVPLEPCREARAAASCKTRGLDDIDYLLGSHTEGFFKSGVAVLFNILTDYLGIDNAAVAQCDPCLLSEKFAVLLGDDQIFDRAFISALNIGGDFFRVVLGYPYKPCELILIVDIDDRLQPAHTDTADDGDILAVNSNIQKGFSDLFRSGGDSAGALTDNDFHCAASLNSFKIFFVLSGVKLP